MDRCEDTLFEYTLMPVHPASFFSAEEFDGAQLIYGFEFSNGYPLLKLRATANARRPPMQGGALDDAVTVLYDLHRDPQQLAPLEDVAVEQRMIDALVAMMKQSEAPRSSITGLG